MKKKVIKSVSFFSNGNMAVFDAQGQVPELQVNLYIMWAELAERCGYDPEGLRINGAKIVRNSDGSWNLE